MKPCNWVVQTNFASESPTPGQIAAACGRQQRPYFSITVLPDSSGWPPVPEVAQDGPLVFHGRSSLLFNALNSPWRHGVFFDPQNFCHRAYVDGFGERMLNFDAQQMCWTDLMQLAQVESGYRFIKPVDDLKSFTGQALSLAAVGTLLEGLRAKHGDSVLQQEVVVASAQEVDAEWRLFVVDQQIVTGSMYRPHDDRELPMEVVAFAKAAIAEWTPAPVFTLDIAQLGTHLRIVECNCFNASRVYAADVDALIAEVSRFQEGALCLITL